MEKWKSYYWKKKQNTVTVQHSPSLVAQIHLWKLHGYKNFKFQISTRGPCKAVQEWRKSREGKEEFIKRLWEHEKEKDWSTSHRTFAKRKMSLCRVFFTVMTMEELNRVYFYREKNIILRKQHNSFTCSCEAYHKTRKAASVMTSKFLLVVGSRMLISPSCLYLVLQPQKKVSGSIRKPIPSLSLGKLTVCLQT